VVIADVLAEPGGDLAEEIRKAGGRAVFELLDVANANDWRQTVERAASLGDLTMLVNNAAIARNEDFEAETEEGYAKLIAVNQTGTWLGMKAAVPEMRKHHGGAIVNVSSIYGTSGGTGTAFAYHASKGAVGLMTRNAAIRLAPESIRVNAVHPGFIDTPMLSPFIRGDSAEVVAMRAYIASTTPLGRIGKPDEIANAIAFLLSDEASFVTGASLYADGGFMAR